MSVTKAEIKQVFTAAVAREFCYIPAENEIEHTFSSTYLQKKEKLIKNTRKTTWYWVNTAAKRAAVIVLLMLALFSVAMSVEAIRTPVVTFFTEIYEKYVLVVYKSNGHRAIEYEYSFSELPEGYEIIGKSSNPAAVITQLWDRRGNTITLVQSVMGGDGIKIDNEQGIVTEMIVGDLPVLVYEHSSTKSVFWTLNGYAFSIDHHGNMATEALIALIKTIE